DPGGAASRDGIRGRSWDRGRAGRAGQGHQGRSRQLCSGDCQRRRNAAGPYRPGTGDHLAGPGFAGVLAPGAALADRGGLLIQTVGQLNLTYQRPEIASQPVRLAPKPQFLAGREELLAEVHTQLAADNGHWPRTVVLSGLGGVGKTSVAVE